MKLEFTKSEIDFLAESIKYDLLKSNLRILETHQLSKIAKYDNFSLVERYFEEAAKDNEEEKDDELKGKHVTEIKKQYISLGSQLKSVGSAAADQLKMLMQAETLKTAISRGNMYVAAILTQSRTSLITTAAKVGVSATIAGAAHTVAATILSIVATALISMVAISVFKMAWALGKTIMRGIVNIVKRYINTIRGKKDPDDAAKEMEQMMKRSKTALNTSKRMIRIIPGKKGQKLLTRINKLDERLSR